MKNRIWHLFLFVALPFFCSSKINESFNSDSRVPDDSLTIIIGITVTDEALIKDVRSKLSQVNNTQIICYCENLRVFIIRGTQPAFSSRSEVYNTCVKALGAYELYLKTGTVKEVLQDCTASDKDDPALIKELYK